MSYNTYCDCGWKCFTRKEVVQCPRCKIDIVTGQKKKETKQSQHWDRLHRHRLTPETRTWFKQWVKEVPDINCDCRKHLKERLKTHPPDFSNDHSWFIWGWKLHNHVSRTHANNPTIELEEAYRIHWPQRKGVGFLSVAYLEIGGTEVWHQTLLPRLGDVSGFVVLNKNFVGGDFSKLGCSSGVGIEAAKKLAQDVEVLVVWGIGDELENVLTYSTKPKVISVSHCDNRSDWTKDIMKGQSPLTDHSVYICPTGKDTVVDSIPCTYIPNAPDPIRIRTDKTKEEARYKLGLKQDDIVLAMITRISPEKGIATIVGAMKHLPDNYKLLVVGSSHGWSYNHKDKLKASKRKNVCFLDPVEKPAEILKASDCLISASEYEGYGLSMAEAMLAGVPVIATPTGLLENNPEFARLVDFKQHPKVWAREIQKDFEEREKQRERVRLARQGIDKVEDFVENWNRLLNQVKKQTEAL